MLHTAHTASTNAFTVGETIERVARSWAPAAAYWPHCTTEREEGDTWCSEEEALCGHTQPPKQQPQLHIYNHEHTRM